MRQAITIGIVFLMVLCGNLRAGSLEPSAAPTAGTMKPLSDVEPRIAIHQSDIPLTISASGSYYLAENVTATGTAISVAADNVILELNGFTITGAGSLYGVRIGGQSNVEIRNGAICNFYYGITGSFSTEKDHRIFNVRVTNCANRGISLASKGCQVRNCTISDIGVSAAGQALYGIVVQNSSVVDKCTITNIGNNATGSSSICGIDAGDSCVLTGNMIYNNGISASGSTYCVAADYGCTVSDNAIYYNGISCTGNVYGISGNNGSMITGNTVYYNGRSAGDYVYGISSGAYSKVSDNVVFSNGYLAAGTVVCGVYGSAASTVTGNAVCYNGLSSTAGSIYGLYLGSYCLVNNNTAYGNNGINMSALASCVLGTNVAP